MVAGMSSDVITLFTPEARATLSPYGAQVMSFSRNDGEEMLWQTTPAFLDAARAEGRALRGGIPLCWPWVGACKASAEAPSHGVARLSHWDILRQTPAQVVLGLEVVPTEGFPHKAKATLQATLRGAVLSVALTTENTGDAPFTYTEALHTYLQVGDITTTRVRGLANLPCHHAGTGEVMPMAEGDLAITAEHDCVYSDVGGVLKVQDPTLNRTLALHHEGCTEAVVFNPWVEKTKRLDMPADGYTTMLCVEAANLRNPVTLEPGATHTLALQLWQQPYKG